MSDEPVAYIYESAHAKSKDGDYDCWIKQVSLTKPLALEGEMRNLTPLYTRRQLDRAYDNGRRDMSYSVD